MAGLKGLKKKNQEPGYQVDIEDVTEKFIGGAKKRVDALQTPKRKRKFERFVFSLTAEVSADIDKLTMHPKTFRVSRSDVVKAAIQHLCEQDEFTINTALAKIAK